MRFIYPELTPDTARPLMDDLEERLYPRFGSLNPSRLYAALCDYKQGINGKYYVSVDIDEEQSMAKAAAEAGGLELREIWEARTEGVPVRALGEHAGWDGIRYDLRPLMRDRRLVWDDTQHDYVTALVTEYGKVR